MLTLVESLSLAGDRTKQNDDACGSQGAAAWVIDGATDLHDTPISGYASDAAWIAANLNGTLYDGFRPGDLQGQGGGALRHALKQASERLRADWVFDAPQPERWMLPTASVLAVSDAGGAALHGADLGDCRCFVLDAEGRGHKLGGHDGDEEARAAADALKRTGASAPLRDQPTLQLLRQKRATHNMGGGYWIFGLQPECADHARAWTLAPVRPAHVLLCTDGFSALVDRYRAYDAAGLVRAALDKGLHELGRELRALETADAAAAKYPRFKQSDDATALLLRLT